MKRVSLKFGAIAVVALGVLGLSTAGAAIAKPQPLGKNGVVYACVKAKGKNKGALRVVRTANGCRKLRGWQPVSWSTNGSSGAAGQAGSQGAGGASGEKGSQGSAGPEGKAGQQGVASTVEKSLVETVQSQSNQIDDLTKQVTDLSGEVLDLEGGLDLLDGGLVDLEGDVTDLGGELGDLEGTVGQACAQLKALTKQTNDIVAGVTGISLNGVLQGLGAVISFPSLPGALGTFECT